MSFIPDPPNISPQVPYFDDVTQKEGWQGMETTKSIERLKSEINEAIGRLGGTVLLYQQGIFTIENKKRQGFRINYVLQHPDGSLYPGRLDIAALPCKVNYRNHSTIKNRQEKALRMALYMLRTALDGTWFLQQLSPGYAPLMPWMIAAGEKTITQIWQEKGPMSHLLPSGIADFSEGEWSEVKS